MEQSIPVGERHLALFKIGKRLRRTGMGFSELCNSLSLRNLQLSEVPLPDTQVKKIAKQLLTETIPFGELNLTKTQINTIASMIWNNSFDPDNAQLNSPYSPPGIRWRYISKEYQDQFIRDFILMIPKVVDAIGLKLVEKQ